MNRYFIIIILLIAFLNVEGQIIATKLESIKKGTSLFHLDMVGYESLLDSTRKSNGVHSLLRSGELDAIAKERCIRMAKILSNSESLSKDYDREVHNENTTPENALYSVGGGVLKDEIEGLTSDEAILVVTNGFFPESVYRINNTYNDSKGHFENRISTKYTKYGTYTVVLFCYGRNPDYEEGTFSMKYTSRRIVINYECFK